MKQNDLPSQLVSLAFYVMSDVNGGDSGREGNQHLDAGVVFVHYCDMLQTCCLVPMCHTES